MPNFRAKDVDHTIWTWIETMLLEPENLALGLSGLQDEAKLNHRSLYDRRSLIESQLTETNSQLERLLDVYISGEIPKEMLLERKAWLEKTVVSSKKAGVKEQPLPVD